MASSSRLSELTSIIQLQTHAIEQYLASNKLQEPSFDLGAPFVLPLSPELSFAQSQVVNAATELLGLINGPLAHVVDLVAPPTQKVTSMHAIQKFGVAHKLKPEEIISYKELADRCGVDVSDLSRVIRECIAWQVFTEPRKGFVAHNAVSLAITQVPFLNEHIGASFGILTPAAVKGPEQMEKWPGSEDATRHGYALATGSEGIMFDTMSKRPSEAKLYSSMVSFLGINPMMNRSNCVRDLAWTGPDVPETIVDVGGGYGALCMEVLRAYPGIKRGIVQDLPEVVNACSVPEDLKIRMEFQPHDIFEPQTTAADAYLLRWVLHDWPTPQCIKILRSLIPELQKGSKLIINEMILPEPGQGTVSEQRMYRSFDMVMKVTTNSQERDLDDWHALLYTVDPKLKIVGIRRTPPALQSNIEVAYVAGEPVNSI